VLQHSFKDYYIFFVISHFLCLFSFKKLARVTVRFGAGHRPGGCALDEHSFNVSKSILIDKCMTTVNKKKVSCNG
jgi:hypothetical protein